MAADTEMDEKQIAIKNAQLAIERNTSVRRGRKNPYSISQHEILRATFRHLSNREDKDLSAVVGDNTRDLRVLKKTAAKYPEDYKNSDSEDRHRIRKFCEDGHRAPQEVDPIQIGLLLDRWQRESERRWVEYFDRVLGRLSDSGRENLLRFAYEVVGPRVSVANVSYSNLFAELPREVAMGMLLDFCKSDDDSE
jgi:hypothetical protein